MRRPPPARTGAPAARLRRCPAALESAVSALIEQEHVVNRSKAGAELLERGHRSRRQIAELGEKQCRLVARRAGSLERLNSRLARFLRA